MTSPNALTTASAPIVYSPWRVAKLPSPPGEEYCTPRILPTVAPVPAPTRVIRVELTSDAVEAGGGG